MTPPVLPRPAVTLDCPQCGGPLAPVILDPETAPWLCNHCALGFWSAELSNAARKDWRPKERDFGFNARELRAACLRERTEARQRGTSLREDMVGQLSGAQLASAKAWLSQRPAAAAVLALVEAAIAAREAVK